MIKVIFIRTELLKMTSRSSMFVKMSSTIIRLTFSDIINIHKNNYKGIGSVRSNYAYINGDYGTSTKHFMNEIEKELNPETTYQIDLGVAWLKFTPLKIKDNEHNIQSS